MKPTNASTSQLLPNRGILTKINAVVRKKSHERNIQIPAEWDEHTAQAYRLLVGPKISEYIKEEAVEEGEAPDQTLDDDENYQKHMKLFSKLRPSRLHKPVQPLKPSEISYEALHFPSDLLVQMFPPDSIKKFDLLDRNSKRRSQRIVKPTVNSSSFSRNSSYLFSSRAPSNRNLNQIVNEINAKKQAAAENLNEEEEEEEESKDEEETKNETGKDSVGEANNEIDPLIVNATARAKLRNIIKLRMFFYIMRCWAHYKINARVKSAFIVDVHNTKVELHVFKSWHKYVITVKRLRECQRKCINFIESEVKKNRFLQWKKRASKAIRNAEAAGASLIVFNERIMRNIFWLFREVAHSKRISRREIMKFYRYKPNGPFAEINEYYTIKRANTIKALHHHFVKSVPPMIHEWMRIVRRTKIDNERTEQVHFILRRNLFHEWFENYHDHFHKRQMEEVRRISLRKIEKLDRLEQEAAENIEKTVMMQLVRDKNVLNAKLNQFDRLSQNHHEAVLRRKQMRKDISKATNDFFRRQEELQFIDHHKQAQEVDRKTREVRIQLAEGFLYHLRRAIRSYDNQVIAHQFCIAFRVLSEPVVQKAVGYFYEKRHLRSLVATASRERKTLVSIVKCAKLYHQFTGWNWWRTFIKKTNDGRTEGLMEVIRRRTQILQLYPYFNWTEVLPVRPPRPLKEVEQMFKDLPLVSIQRKVARERVHHVNVKLLLMRRRVLRDFMRALAAHVQTQIATREVMKLLRKKQNLRLVRSVFDAFIANAQHKEIEFKTSEHESEINSNIIAWERHFFRARNKQTKIVNSIPYS
ncbi:hypothetical protein TRFO_16890 [Tritrichomonas foetus]|uniref:Uncharacterized protein n=1 Tax=Tritrichomonas foetus TaxID=1144522 RepID=A0A1J4KTY7_9EUKA|nr:hypothetical protein TRFO_16890 [Tritrichomonas foetus]|eukprot:OHT13126.1 hypothetical protein TRFO_16890 [Tritrichomonas foetus]